MAKRKAKFFLVPPFGTNTHFFAICTTDYLQWVTNEKKIVLFLRQFHENCRSKTISCRKLGNFSKMQDNALRHREGLKG